MKYYVMAGVIFAAVGLQCSDDGAAALRKEKFFCLQALENYGPDLIQCIYIGLKRKELDYRRHCDHRIWLASDCCLFISSVDKDVLRNTKRKYSLIDKLFICSESAKFEWLTVLSKDVQRTWIGLVAKLLLLSTPWFGSNPPCLTVEEKEVFEEKEVLGENLIRYLSAEIFTLVASHFFSEVAIVALTERLSAPDLNAVMHSFCLGLDNAVVNEVGRLGQEDQDRVLEVFQSVLISEYPQTTRAILGNWLNDYENVEQQAIALEALVRRVEESFDTDYLFALEDAEIIFSWIMSSNYEPLIFRPLTSGLAGSETAGSASGSSLERESNDVVLSGSVSGAPLSDRTDSLMLPEAEELETEILVSEASQAPVLQADPPAATPVRTIHMLGTELVSSYRDRIDSLAGWFRLRESRHRIIWATLFNEIIKKWSSYVHFLSSMGNTKESEQKRIEQAALQQFMVSHRLFPPVTEVAVGKKPWCCF